MYLVLTNQRYDTTRNNSIYNRDEKRGQIHFLVTKQKIYTI
jgi:hypothetical protein